MLLRQGTAVTIHVGPAIATGGLAIVSTLKASTVTRLAIIKHGATAVVTVTGRTFGHLTNGQYRLSLLSGDTNTRGHLRAFCQATGTVKSLYFWRDFDVIPAAVYDALVSGTTKLNVGTLASGLAVWQVAARTLTSAGVAWTAGTRTLTSASVAWSAATRTLTSGANVSSSVWSAATRTLTSAGVAWSAGTRTLTSGDAAAVSVWAAASRTLTSAGVAWSAGTRTLTSGLTVGASVWVAGTRTLTSAGVAWTAAGRTLTSAATVWNSPVPGTYASGRAGWYIDTRLSNISGGTGGGGASATQVADAVWGAGIRTLTSGLTVASSVWVGAGTRTLTSGGSVWSAGARTLTSAGVAWTAAARTLTSGATAAASVWVASGRTLSSGGVVWTSGVRTLTATAYTDAADALLKRDMAAPVGEAARSPLNAFRFLRNKWTLSTAGVLSVKEEDDVTEAWNATVTTATGADPVTGVDPA